MDKNKILAIVGAVAFVALIVISVVISPSGNGSGSNTLTEDPNVILSNAQEESAKVEDSEKGEFHQINVDTYLAYLAGTEAKAVLVARPTCTYCQIAEPIVQKIIHDYNADINYLNTDNFQGDDQVNFINSDDAFKEGFGTPMLLVVHDNKVVDTVDGLTDTAHYVAFLTKYGFIK